MDTSELKAFDVQCDDCKHQHEDGVSCDAFPDRIPNDILMGRYDHKKPYPGDHGIRFEPVEESE